MWKVILILGFISTFAAGAQHEKVRLTDVQVLTLYRDQYTTGRRAPPVPQLKCVGGSAAKTTYHPDTVQCYNRGFDGSDVQWECKADLDNAVKFGKINVYCEGYDYPDDPYILKGSCGLEYHLDYVSGRGQGYGQGQKTYQKPDQGEGGAGSVVIFLIVCVVVYIIYANCLRSNPDDQPPSGQSRFRGGGPPPPPFGGPPPPYDERPPGPPGDAPPPYGFKQQGASASGFQEQQHRQTHMGAGAGAGAAPGAGAGAGPGGAGFWTGLGTGGMLGYLFGRNTGGGRYGGGSTWDRPAYVPPTRHTYGDDRDFGFFGSSTTTTRSDSSSGSGTRSASGFGGTRRR